MRALILLLFTFPLAACTKKSDMAVAQPVTNTLATAPPIAVNDSVSYLALGDSYTYGVGLPQDQSYPYQLAAQLRAGNYLASSPAIVAFQGWTVSDLLSRLQASNIHQKFSFVTILIGVNDQNKGTNPDTYRLQLDALITQAIAYAHGYSNRVFVISIPDWSVTPFAASMDTAAIKAGITLFNSINENESRKLSAHYVDVTTLSEQAKNDPTLFGSDGLHPSEKGYAQWVNQIYGSVVASFK